MKCRLYIIVSVFLIISCSYQSEMTEKLSAVESIMEERPDSALQVLNAVDTLQLKNRKDKALYALLLSQALDKNYIDTTNTNVIQPAVDYFENSGDTYHSMMAHYYQGRVLYNAGQYPQSLIITLKAYEEAKKLDNKFWTAMSARSIRGIYTKTHHGPEGIRYAQIALENFKVSEHKRHYLWSIADLATAYNDNGDYDSSIVIAQEALDSAIIAKETIIQTVATRLIGMSYFGRGRYAEAIPYYVEVCSDLQNATAADSAHLAILYINNNQADKARPFIDAVSDNTESFSQWMKYELYSKTGNTEKALKALEVERMLINKNVNNLIRQNLNGTLIDYNTAQELKRKAELRTMQLILVIVLVIFVLVFIWIRLRMKIIQMQKVQAEQEKEKYMLMCHHLEDEKNELSQIVEHNQKLDSRTKEIISSYRNQLNDFYVDAIIQNNAKNSSIHLKLTKIVENKSRFLKALRESYEENHPKFIKHLMDCGLSERDIHYCCLLAIGLKVKEIGDYIQLDRTYVLSSDIRAKLGLKGSLEQLGNYIQTLLQRN